MASNYNTRPRGAEVLVDGDRFAVVTQRERTTISCIWRSTTRGSWRTA